MTLTAVHDQPQTTLAQENTPRVSIVIPAYNEQDIIGDVLDRLNMAHYHEIIVVDDGSKDETAAVARAHGAHVIVHPYNIGNGAAVKTGIRAATGDIIVLMDGDGQHPPEDVPRLVANIGDYDMVVGARTSESQANIQRRIANQVFNAYATYVIGYPIPDLTSGFRAVKAPVLKSFNYLLPNGFSYPSTITIALFRSGFRVRYETIVSPQRPGASKIRPLQDGLRFLLTITRLATLFVPMKVFLPVSLLFLTVGGGYGAYLLIDKSRFSNMPTLLIMVGIMIFLIGLVAEQIAMLRLQHTDKT